MVTEKTTSLTFEEAIYLIEGAMKAALSENCKNPCTHDYEFDSDSLESYLIHSPQA